jgi:hypothetical protein
MTREELTAWALGSGFRMIDGHPSLTKPSRPTEAIVRLVLKTTVAHVEVKKPAGKWEKLAGASYAAIVADEDSGLPRGLGLIELPGFAKLMQANRDSMVFGKPGG